MVKEKSAISELQITELASIAPSSPLLACTLKEKLLGNSPDSALEELQVTAQATWQKLDRYLGALVKIATIAPLLGLFGTVVGMIEIFGSQGAINGSTGSPQ